MAYALLCSDNKEREYHETIIKFLESLEADDVSGVVLIGVTESGPHLFWNCTPLEMAAAASVLQAQVVIDYQENMAGEDDEDVEDDD